MITQELMTAVMEHKNPRRKFLASETVVPHLEGTTLRYVEFHPWDEDTTHTTNIHEFVHDCRVWAVSTNHNIDSRTWLSDKESYPNYPENTVLFDMRVEGIEKGYEARGNCCLHEFNHKQELKYEPLAVIQACEWIVGNNL